MSYASEQRVLNAQMNTEFMRQSPSVLYRPRVYIDGNKWCALYGDNLQDGVAGFGDSPADAMYAFDQAWIEKLKPGPTMGTKNNPGTHMHTYRPTLRPAASATLPQDVHQGSDVYRTGFDNPVLAAALLWLMWSTHL